MGEPIRLDTAMVKQGLTRSRETAKEAILAGMVTVNGKVQQKPSFLVSSKDNLVSEKKEIFVGRGGHKLEGAIKCFSICLQDKLCLDAGASTGGFTDCMLKNGASLVYAVEGGHDQLAESLRSSQRVRSYENTDIRNMPREITTLMFDFIACDLSFISLKLVMPHLFPLLNQNGEACLLVKPQFEVGRASVGKNGIVKSQQEHFRVLKEVVDCIHNMGIKVGGLQPSPIRGGSGNIEYLLYCGAVLQEACPNIQKVVSSAFCDA